MKRSVVLFAAGVLLFLISCKHDELSQTDKILHNLIPDKTRYILPDEKNLAEIPQFPVNPLTPEKVELGKKIFFDPIFANEAKRYDMKYTYTCSTCHVVESGFRAGRMQGIADGGYGFGNKGEARIKYPYYANDSIDAQGARPLAQLNVAYVENTFWSGAFGSDGKNSGLDHIFGVHIPLTEVNKLGLPALESQNIEGLGVHRQQFTKKIVEDAGYKELFDKALPDLPEEERYTRKGASFAISAFLRQLLTTQAPFQLWLKGDEDAMTDQQKKGAALFFGKAGCTGCHYEKNLGSMKFEALGVDDLYEHGGLNTGPNDARNLGRAFFTNRPEDKFKFRTPQLYNMGDSGPYFHGGSIETIEGVIKYFNTGKKQNQRVPDSQLSSFIRPLGLTDEEVADLTEFVKNGLRDPNLKRYKPDSVPSGLCFPNNDPSSKVDMGCN